MLLAAPSTSILEDIDILATWGMNVEAAIAEMKCVRPFTSLSQSEYPCDRITVASHVQRYGHEQYGHAMASPAIIEDRYHADAGGDSAYSKARPSAPHKEDEYDDHDKSISIYGLDIQFGKDLNKNVS